MSRSYKRINGFTIVELLIVVVVIAILAAITLVSYNGITGQARDSVAISNAQQAGTKITVSALSDGVLPATLAAAGLSDTASVTYQYTLNEATAPDTFCLTATTSGASAHIAGSTNGANSPVLGPCAGHTGTAPTTLAGGDSCPTGYIVVPGSSLYNTDTFCVMKYEAKDVGGVATSQAAGLPWVTISQTNAIAEASALGAGYHLITESEWLTIAQNIISVGSNWSGGTVGSGSMYRGHTDNVPTNSLAAAADSDPYSGTGQTTGIERRTFTLTNGEVMWDLAGNVDEWTSGTTEGGNQPGAPGGIWREWNALTVAGNFSPDPFPAYASSSATAWTSAQSIGQIYSDSSQTGPRSFRRGGGWYYGSAGG
ncbi:prepilin-type N-terminal cleavage/methylation domain-containing protein, partial [Candidatus Saccharibacteria bacterium]|nr:prepilin-type N-terminal cleavage/methylation domain-containing protein [Candidatus Saccharibacteria bacterium]